MNGSSSAALWRQVAAQARLGTSVPDALERIRLSPRDGPLAGRLADALRRGSTLTAALRDEGMPAAIVAAVGVSESAGNLPGGLEDLAALLEEAQMRESSWRVALAYPQMLAVVLLAVALLAGFVVQEFRTPWHRYGQASDLQPFLSSGARAPSAQSMLLQLLFGVHSLLWTPPVGVLVLSLLGVLHLVLSGRAGMESVRLRMPFVGDWLRRLEIVTWLRWLDWFTSRGVPLAESARTAAQACSSTPCRTAFQRVASHVEHGASLASALGRERLVPELVTWLVERAEQAEFRGHLLLRASVVIERDAAVMERGFFPLAEHFAIIVLGMGTGLVVLSFYLQFHDVGGLF